MRLLPALFLLPLLSACGGGGNDPVSPPPPPPPPSVASVRLSATDVALVSGASAQLVATALDAAGQTVAGKSAAWTTDDANVAPVTASGSVTGTRVGTARVTATIDGKTASAQVVVTTGPATALEVTAGNDQDGEVGAAPPTAPQVRVRDFGNNPVVGAVVTLAVTSGDGRLIGPATVTTNAAGTATVTNWRLGVLPGPNILTASNSGLSTPIRATGRYPRATADRPDEVQGNQFHLIYAVPSDGVDRALDGSGRLAVSAAVAQRFLAVSTGGRRLKLDTFNGGVLDITFVRLSRTDARIGAGANPVDSIEVDLAQSGTLKPGKLYLVWYDGGSRDACAQAKLPPGNPGQVGALYLKGSFSGGTGQCLDLAAGMAAAPSDAPKYWEFLLAHEALHTIGVVGAQAPHHQAAFPGHVPEPTDLMYAGTAPWAPSVVDVGGDDYAGSGLAGSVPNLLTSSFGETVPSALLMADRQAMARTPFAPLRGIRIDLACRPVTP
ncbi:MAG: Ig-like domain-containing protein [Gemmatimonadales bacterium]|nr:Ig-like domain-containing protein [Gemmatimonadales bacterium]